MYLPGWIASFFFQEFLSRVTSLSFFTRVKIAESMLEKTGLAEFKFLFVQDNLVIKLLTESQLFDTRTDGVYVKQGSRLMPLISENWCDLKIQ